MADNSEPISLKEFGRRAKCDYTTASRLLTGDRAPSTRLLVRICDAFDLDKGEALGVLAKDQARTDGKHPAFAEYLRDNVFSPRSQVPAGRPKAV